MPSAATMNASPVLKVGGSSSSTTSSKSSSSTGSRRRIGATPPPPPPSPKDASKHAVLVAGGVAKAQNEMPTLPGSPAVRGGKGGGTAMTEQDADLLAQGRNRSSSSSSGASNTNKSKGRKARSSGSVPSLPPDSSSSTSLSGEHFWLFVCFLGIMISFVCYGLLLEYTTSGGRKLHELSFLFVTSTVYTLTAAAGRYVRAEKPVDPADIPPFHFAVLGVTSMGSTFCSVRSLRYVIYPIQVLAKSCKPVPVMLMGALMGKRYPLKKYINVCLIVLGVAMFMGGGDGAGKNKRSSDPDESGGPGQSLGILLLFISLCFDGGTGAYEDKLMSVHHIGPFDLMYNIQLGKTILAGVALVVLNQVHVFMQMCSDMGFLLVALGLSGAMGQVFIFVTISKFGALTCSIIGLARKVTTLVASIYFYGHALNSTQVCGLVVAVGAMVFNFWGKSGGKKGGGGGGHGAAPPPAPSMGKKEKMDEEQEANDDVEEEDEEDEESPMLPKDGNIELGDVERGAKR